MSANNGFAPIPTHAHTDYTTRYRCTFTDDDYAIHTHGNGIAVLTLAPTHPIRRLRKKVVTVAWQGVSAKSLQTQDRSKAKVSGKRKKGGVFLEPNSVLGQVECSDGSFYDLRASVHGKLVEVNESLRSQANLMSSDASWAGYLALFQLMPKSKAMLSLEDRMLEGSEAERDVGETAVIREEARLETKASDATPDAAASSTTAVAAAATAAQEQARLEGRAWQSSIEYLTPQQYLAKRSNFFVQT